MKDERRSCKFFRWADKRYKRIKTGLQNFRYILEIKCRPVKVVIIDKKGVSSNLERVLGVVTIIIAIIL